MVDVPHRMKALVQSAPKGILELREVEVPKPQKGQVLVKMDFASINPSDLSFLQATYVDKPNYPVIPGIEGSGLVVKSGGGLIPALRLGKRVACTSTATLGGSWAEYMVTSAMHVIPIPSKMSSQSAASLIVNPLTAIAFIQMAMLGMHKTIVNNAAGGALGKMLVRLAARYEVNLISLVRSEAQREALLRIGAKNVLNTSDLHFEVSFQQLIDVLKPKLFFDAIGGQSTDDFVRYSPEGSTIILYANLSEQPSSFEPRLLLQQQKTIQGFYLGHHTAQQSIPKALRNIKLAQQYLQEDLKTEVRKLFSLSQATEAIDTYSKEMSQGKVLLSIA
jgi:NADPH:quinone reductase-like Zn-dependent oxidoreductase